MMKPISAFSSKSANQLPTLLLSLTLLLGGCHTVGNKAGMETKAAVTVTPDGSWSEPVHEHLSSWAGNDDDEEGSIRCAEDKVMVGRNHEGDEEGLTAHKCASLQQNGRTLKVVNGDSYDAHYVDEHVEYWFKCSGNGVMTGRAHSGDEEGDTWYFCGKIKDQWGDEIIPINRTWTGPMNETDSTHTCPTDQVMTGRSHAGDEDGSSATHYQCATLY